MPLFVHPTKHEKTKNGFLIAASLLPAAMREG